MLTHLEVVPLVSNVMPKALFCSEKRAYFIPPMDLRRKMDSLYNTTGFGKRSVSHFRWFEIGDRGLLFPPLGRRSLPLSLHNHVSICSNSWHESLAFVAHNLIKCGPMKGDSWVA